MIFIFLIFFAGGIVNLGYFIIFFGLIWVGDKKLVKYFIINFYVYVLVKKLDFKYILVF